MPPLPFVFEGADSIRPLMADAAEMGEWRVIPTGANRMPAAAGYLRRPGDSLFRAFKLDVMRIEAGTIAEITTFNADLFPAFGLPPAAWGARSLAAVDYPAAQAGRTRPLERPSYPPPSENLDPVAHNRAAWDREVERGNEWTQPVGPDVIARARSR